MQDSGHAEIAKLFLKRLLVFWQKQSLRRRIFLALSSVWWFIYLTGVRRIALHYGKGGNPGSSREARNKHLRLKGIVDQCPSLHQIYWPVWYAYVSVLQLQLLGLKEFRARFLQRSPYQRQILNLSDGSRIALDWVLPAGDKSERDRTSDVPANEQPPVVVLLHGFFQDSSSATMIDLGVSLAKRGMPVVVMNRRGYGGLKLDDKAVKMSIYGFDEDLDEVLYTVSSRYPGRLVAIVGFSCGSAYALRYGGTRGERSAWRQTKGSLASLADTRKPSLLCTVAYDSGYDVGAYGAITHIPFYYRIVILWAVKYTYGFRHRNQLREKSNSFCGHTNTVMNPTVGVQGTFRALRRLSGIQDSSAWLDKHQPRLEDIELPSLLVNSRDDPIHRWLMVEKFWADIRGNPNLVLAELQRGSHGCKWGFWGFNSIIDGMVGEFVLAAQRELLKSLSTTDSLNPR